MGAYIIVCANVPDNDLKVFDNWYETEHVVDAPNGFGAINASRGLVIQTFIQRFMNSQIYLMLKLF